MTVFDRIETIKKAYNLKNDSALARELALNPAYFSRVKRGLYPLCEKVIERFLSHLPGLSESFIRDGIGDPIDPNRQAEIDRETAISFIMRNFRRLEPAAQEILLESARRLAETGGKKTAPENTADFKNLRKLG